MMMQRITSKCPPPLESGRFGLRQGKYNEKRETRSSPESIIRKGGGKSFFFDELASLKAFVLRIMDFRYMMVIMQTAKFEKD
ncbi:hypothetical protein RIR_jg32877.t1 [Rhizophagus irregularis DAOM 181602=DAOM 197198]|nr:hypothetical protein RIR_jg32877.t1 [Rhizophagus irregularis DAOM 181602=DAOM 197198]